MNPAITRILRFLLVGGTGFAVDALVLHVMVSVGIFGPLAARVFSIALAGLATWQLNRNFTFAPSGGSQLAEATRYGSVLIVSSCVNYLIYAGLILAIGGLQPLVALVGSSIGAMGLSYVGYDRFVFWDTTRELSDTN